MLEIAFAYASLKCMHKSSDRKGFDHTLLSVEVGFCKVELNLGEAKVKFGWHIRGIGLRKRN